MMIRRKDAALIREGIANARLDMHPWAHGLGSLRNFNRPAVVGRAYRRTLIHRIEQISRRGTR
jgi:hypothetical protein